MQDNNIELTKIDVINNEFISDYVQTSNLGAKIRFIVFIKFENNQPIVHLKNIQHFKKKYNDWINEDRLMFFDERALPEKIIHDIFEILNNNERYEQVKNSVYNDFSFHYLVIRDLTKEQRQNWVKKNMLGRTYKFNVTLNNFKKNTTGKLNQKKYIAEFSNNSKSQDNDMLIINYITNSKTLEKLNNSSSVKISGKLVESIDIADYLINESNIYITDHK
jgi:hypothetical protein